MKKKCKNFLVIFATALTYSCIPLPYYYPSAPPIRIMQAEDFEPGVTKKEDVFLRFGNSFTISLDEKDFWYTYKTDDGTYGVFLLFFNTGKSISDAKMVRYHELKIEFDEDDIIKNCTETVSEYPPASVIKLNLPPWW